MDQTLTFDKFGPCAQIDHNLFEPKDSGDNQSYIQMSDGNTSYLPQERSTSLMYGKKGLLNFLDNLFVDLNEKDKQKINFYFTIRNNILEFVDLKHHFNKNLMMPQKKNQ